MSVQYRYNNLDSVGTEISENLDTWNSTDRSTQENSYEKILKALGKDGFDKATTPSNQRQVQTIFNRSHIPSSSQQRGGSINDIESFVITDSSLDDETKATLKNRNGQAYAAQEYAAAQQNQVHQRGGFFGLFGNNDKIDSKATRT